jgi:hypothetical protein
MTGGDMTGGEQIRRTHRRGALVLLAALVLAAGSASAVEAQFSSPCSVGCGLLLAANSYVFATATSTAVGRALGGFSNPRQGIISWSSGFVAAAGAGMLLSGDGQRQRRAVRGAGLGAVGGALVGLTAESMLRENTSATRLAATLIGAGLGVAIGGAVGAWSGEASPTDVPVAALLRPTFVFRIGF